MRRPLEMLFRVKGTRGAQILQPIWQLPPEPSSVETSQTTTPNVSVWAKAGITRTGAIAAAGRELELTPEALLADRPIGPKLRTHVTLHSTAAGG
jgi:hypothetical protein